MSRPHPELHRELDALEADLGPVMAKVLQPRLDRIRKLAAAPQVDLGQAVSKAQELLDLLKSEGKEKQAPPQPKRTPKAAAAT